MDFQRLWRVLKRWIAILGASAIMIGIFAMIVISPIVGISILGAIFIGIGIAIDYENEKGK